MMKLRKNQKGFTLIEVLLIVVILGIIAAIAIPRLMASRQEAQLKSCHSTVANLNTAVEKYYFDFGVYPDDAASTYTFDQIVAGEEMTLPDASTTVYVPDGAQCPVTGGAFTMDGTTKRVTCSEHGNIYGT